MVNYLWIGRKNAHRVIMEKHINRKLTKDEIVHHKDGDKTNNDIENLKIMSRSEHINFHRKIHEMIELTCYECGKCYSLSKKRYDWLIKKERKPLFCSRSCKSIQLPPPIKTIGIKKEKIILEETKNGLSGYQISEKYGISTTTIYKYIKSNR